MVRAIPRGRVLGYGQVAALLGSPRGARRVGWALAGLPEGSDVPWHRVLRSSGHLAFTGSPHRALIQQRLLEEEGVVFGDDPGAPSDCGVRSRIDMATWGWRPSPEELASLLRGGGAALSGDPALHPSG